jgi:hypothetical protein
MNKRPLQQLRTAAEKILQLTDGCETLPQAAHKLYLHTESESLTDNRHEEAVLDLEHMNICMHTGMQMLIDLYIDSAKLEVEQNGI